MDVSVGHRRADSLRQQHHSSERRRADSRHLRPHRRGRPHRARHHEQDGRRIAAPRRGGRRAASRATSPKIPICCRCCGKQKYQKVSRFFPATAGDHAAGPRPRRHPRLQDGGQSQADRRGHFFERRITVRCWRIRKGLFARYEQTRSEFSVTILEANSSGWAKANSPDIRKIDPERLAESASRKAAASREPRELPAGPLHHDPRAVGGPRSGRFSLLRFRGHRRARQALLLHRPHGQESSSATTSRCGTTSIIRCRPAALRRRRRCRGRKCCWWTAACRRIWSTRARPRKK